ncbi:MAG: hypothetical protein GX998_09125 [Firmicutes bacterium]|nr:hypothetical protein [Bacillota bacterium]
MSVDAEKTILALPEVEACRIIYHEGELEQIYVSANIPTQQPAERLQHIKSLVRSVVGALALEHGWEIDYRKVKVVDSLETDEPRPREREPRVRIIAAYVRYFPEPQVRVELNLGSSTYSGEAPFDDAHPSESTIAAFLRAFHQMGLGQANLIFAYEIPSGLSHRTLVIVKLQYRYDDGEGIELLGIGESQQDLILCTVRACLDALNRKIGLHSP